MHAKGPTGPRSYPPASPPSIRCAATIGRTDYHGDQKDGTQGKANPSHGPRLLWGILDVHRASGTRIELHVGPYPDTRESPPSQVDAVFSLIGEPGAIRTPGPQIRSLMLYPAELRVRTVAASSAPRWSMQGRNHRRRLTPDPDSLATGSGIRYPPRRCAQGPAARHGRAPTRRKWQDQGPIRPCAPRPERR